MILFNSLKKYSDINGILISVGVISSVIRFEVAKRVSQVLREIMMED